MPAVALATGRATLAGHVEGDGPDERGYPGPPGWGLGVRLTALSCKKLIVTKPNNKPRNKRRPRPTPGCSAIEEEEKEEEINYKINKIFNP